MRVLILIPGLSGGGAEQVVCYLAEYLPKEWQIDILVRKAEEPPAFPANVHIVKRSLWGMFSYLGRSKKEGAYDLYNSHMASCNFLNMVTGAKSGSRILTIHNTTSIQMQSLGVVGRVYGRVIRALYHRAEQIVAVSEYAGNDLSEVYHIPRERIEVIPNGVDLQKIRRLADEPLAREWEETVCGEPIVCAVGRYAYAKGFSHLIRAFRRVVARYGGARLVLVGEGECRQEYERIIEESGLGGNVILTGWVNNPYNLIRRADILVSCSIYEGFSLVSLEAGLCGTPCVLSDRPGGIEEFFGCKGGNTENAYLPEGICCPAIDESDGEQENLAEAILYMWRNRDYASACAGNAARRCARFSVENMVSRWARLMEGSHGKNIKKV